MKFAENLTALRKALGETQEQLGEALGVSGKTISKWESAASEPDLGTLTALSEHFAVSVDELLGRPKPADAVAMMRVELAAEPTMAGKFRRANKYATGLIESMFGDLRTAEDEPLADAIPEPAFRDSEYRTIIQHPMGTLVSYYTEDVRVAAQVWRNEADFAWLRDDREQMAEFFALFADPDMLALLYVLERLDFSQDFTAAYAAEHAGITEEKAAELLDRMLKIKGYRYNSGALSKSQLETLDGECTVYNCSGFGTTMAILSLARALVTGWNSNRNAYNDCGKMIGERGTK